jgi:hypothetical protein
VFRRQWPIDLIYFFLNSLLIEVLTLFTVKPVAILFDRVRIDDLGLLPLVIQVPALLLVADFTQVRLTRHALRIGGTVVELEQVVGRWVRTTDSTVMTVRCGLTHRLGAIQPTRCRVSERSAIVRARRGPSDEADQTQADNRRRGHSDESGLPGIARGGAVTVSS